jgi:hypothetical protein
MKSAIVLKSFPYAHDGIHVRELAKGEAFEVQEDVFDGLVKAGYIKPSKSQADLDAKAYAEAAAKAAAAK